MAKKNLIIDTNVLLSDSDCLKKFDNNDLIIPIKVLEELDKHKKRQDSIGFHARQAIKQLDALRESGTLFKGVKLGKGLGTLRVVKASDEILANLPKGLSHSNPDNLILATALTVQEETPTKKTVVISQDVNMRVTADALGLLTEDYNSSSVISSGDMIYEGFVKVLVSDVDVDDFYAGESIWLYEDEVAEQKITLYPNQFVMLVSVENEKKTAIGRFIDFHMAVQPLIDLEESLSWKVRPKNKEQKCGFDLLMNPEIPLVTLVGRAGSGKTLMAVAAGLEQVFGIEKGRYDKIIISRPVQPMGKDIGFLPGTMEEKLLPWLKPIQDNLQFVMGKDKTMFEQCVEKGTIEIEALTYIRGRSINNAFIIIDEAQNLTSHEVKTIITRVGENTKLVLTGDVEQIDNIYINETSNGLTYAIEKMKESRLTGHITFKKGERSSLATEAAKLM